jgi:hypothetical protein
VADGWRMSRLHGGWHRLGHAGGRFIEATRPVACGAGRQQDLARKPSHTKPDGTVARTLWGELAYQLGGLKAYTRIQADDEKATGPGDVLRELLRIWALPDPGGRIGGLRASSTIRATGRRTGSKRSFPLPRC